MRKLLFFFVASLFVFGKCNKDDNSSSTVDFLPLNSGTFWNYLVVNTAATTTTSNLLLTVTGKDTTINTKTYKVLSNSAGANNYWAKVSSDYYRFGIVPGATAAGNVEELYLKDNLDVNGTWSSTIPVNYTVNSIAVTLNVVANYKIGVKDSTMTVTAGSSTNNFTGVTRVNVVFTTSYPPFIPLTTLGSGNFYYAKGIGLISQSVSINANTTLAIAASSLKWDIQSYQIK